MAMCSLVPVFSPGLYFLLGRGLISGIRATKQIENVMRSPVVHHISSTVSGLPVIRVFQREHLFAQRQVFRCGYSGCR